MSLISLKHSLLRSLHHLLRVKQDANELLVGLDIGPGFVKLLKMDPSEDPCWVEAFGLLPLPLGAITKDEIKDPLAVAQTLKRALEDAEVKTKNVALAIPRSSTIIKTISVSKRLSAKDIESRAWVEANHHYPDLVGDIFLDFDILGQSSQDPTLLDLLLVACRKDHIKPYLDLMQTCGLQVGVIDVNCYAFERSLGLMMKQWPDLNTVALLNLDYNLSSLIVIHNGQMIYAHDHSYEGLHLATQVNQYLDALKSNNKSSQASAGTGEYLDILKAGISAHLRHSMHFFYSSRPHITIQKLVVSGDCANLPQLHSLIQQETGIDTVLANPFSGMTLASSVDPKSLEQHASSLMLSCGLALSKIKEAVI